MSSPLTNTLTVWHALFLREALDRFFGSRGAWVWLIFEPVSQIIIMCLIFSVLRSVSPGGSDIVLWLCIGMIGFFMFRRTAVQTLHAVDCNKAFFAFRQVRPFDAAFARGGVEAFSMALIAIFILGPLAFFGKNVLPDNWLVFLAAMAGLWLFGFGYGLITSVLQRLVPESGHISQIILMPLYLISGTIMPLEFIPQPYREGLMLNPLAHGLELARDGFFQNYHPVDSTSMAYFYMWILILLFVGLVLYKLFDTRLLTR